eukprot:363547-Chlamydomonas_euryale.AAC.3
MRSSRIGWGTKLSHASAAASVASVASRTAPRAPGRSTAPRRCAVCTASTARQPAVFKAAGANE